MTLSTTHDRAMCELLTSYLQDTHGLEYREAWQHAERLLSRVDPWIAFRARGWRLEPAPSMAEVAEAVSEAEEPALCSCGHGYVGHATGGGHGPLGVGEIPKDEGWWR